MNDENENDNHKKSGFADFGQALRLMKDGWKVARLIWAGRGEFVFLDNGYKPSITPFMQHDMRYEKPNTFPCFVQKKAINQLRPGWVPSLEDMLAEDWHIVGR